jgi:hypothetical protein
LATLSRKNYPDSPQATPTNAVDAVLSQFWRGSLCEHIATFVVPLPELQYLALKLKDTVMELFFGETLAVGTVSVIHINSQ